MSAKLNNTNAGILPENCRIFDAASYAKFLKDIGFEKFKMIIVEGRMPMAVAVWEMNQK
jgi:hypothetical protein